MEEEKKKVYNLERREQVVFGAGGAVKMCKNFLFHLGLLTGRYALKNYLRKWTLGEI